MLRVNFDPTLLDSLPALRDVVTAFLTGLLRMCAEIIYYYIIGIPVTFLILVAYTSLVQLIMCFQHWWWCRCFCPFYSVYCCYST